MSSRPPKPKFIPPIRTAASFLGSVARSPDSRNRPAMGVIKEFVPEFLLQKKPSRMLRNSGALSDRVPGCFSPKPMNDHDEHFKSQSPPPTFIEGTHAGYLLPITPHHLKTFLTLNKELSSRCRISRGKLCLKEKCLETMAEHMEDPKTLIFEENYRQNYDFGYHSGNSDIQNLKDWFDFMKKKYLYRFVQDQKIYKKLCLEELEEELSLMELVLRAGLQECIKQVSMHSMDRGDLLGELIKYYKVYSKAKAFHENNNSQDIITNLKLSLGHIKEEMDKLRKDSKDKEDNVIYK